MEEYDISQQSTVQLFLNREAMIGLGTELIRRAHDFQVGYHVHLKPSANDFQSQVMGIFLTGTSASMIIGCDDLGTIDEHVEESGKE